MSAGTLGTLPPAPCTPGPRGLSTLSGTSLHGLPIPAETNKQDEAAHALTLRCVKGPTEVSPKHVEGGACAARGTPAACSRDRDRRPRGTAHVLTSAASELAAPGAALGVVQAPGPASPALARCAPGASSRSLHATGTAHPQVSSVYRRTKTCSCVSLLTRVSPAVLSPAASELSIPPVSSLWCCSFPRQLPCGSQCC